MIDGFAVGPLFIRFYGIILMLGAVAGGWLATREMKRRGHDPEMVWDLLVYLIIGGVIGARLWHIFTPPPLLHKVSQLSITSRTLWTQLPSGRAVWASRGPSWAAWSRCTCLSEGTRKSPLSSGRILLRPAWHWARRLGAGATSSIKSFTGLLRTSPGKYTSIRRTASPVLRMSRIIIHCLPTNRSSTWQTCCYFFGSSGGTRTNSNKAMFSTSIS